MNRRLALAYGWGKFLAITLSEYESTRKGALKLRERGNWAILVADDEVALQYQRLEFRLRRAMRAVGAWGMAGYGTLDVLHGQLITNWKSPEALAAMNADNFQQTYRSRAMRAKQCCADKRHPRRVLDEMISAHAWQEELASMSGSY